MKKLYKTGSIITLAIAFFFLSNFAMAQTATGDNTINLGIPELALLATTAAPLSLELTTDIAGQAIQSSAQDSAFIQVSSIIGQTGFTRKITAAYDVIPTATVLKVSATEPSNGNQGGTIGTGLADVTLSTTAQNIVTGIGSCYTGTNSNDGYRLIYTWSTNPDLYENIVATSSAVAVVTLTLTDDAL